MKTTYLGTRDREIVHGYTFGHDPGATILENFPEITLQGGIGDSLGAFRVGSFGPLKSQAGCTYCFRGITRRRNQFTVTPTPVKPTLAR